METERQQKQGGGGDADEGGGDGGGGLEIPGDMLRDATRQRPIEDDARAMGRGLKLLLLLTHAGGSLALSMCTAGHST